MNVTSQVLNTIHYISPNRKNYQQDLWQLISSFPTFNIKFVPRINNVAKNTLASEMTKLSLFVYGFFIEIIYKPSIPDTITNLHDFNDDQCILHFMVNDDIFKDMTN